MFTWHTGRRLTFWTHHSIVFVCVLIIIHESALESDLQHQIFDVLYTLLNIECFHKHSWACVCTGKLWNRIRWKLEVAVGSLSQQSSRALIWSLPSVVPWVFELWPRRWEADADALHAAPPIHVNPCRITEFNRMSGQNVCVGASFLVDTGPNVDLTVDFCYHCEDKTA